MQRIPPIDTIGGMLRRVDVLLEGTDSTMGLEDLTYYYNGITIATPDDIGSHGEFESEDCAILWSNLLVRYLDMCDFFSDARHVREQIPGRPGSALERTWRRLDTIDVDFMWAWDSPTYLAYERPWWFHLVGRFADHGEFNSFIDYLRRIHYFIRTDTASEIHRNELQTILNGVRYPIGTMWLKYKDILIALRELREELVSSVMQSFAMGTHGRLGEGSRVSLLERDTLSIIRDMLEDKNH